LEVFGRRPNIAPHHLTAATNLHRVCLQFLEGWFKTKSPDFCVTAPHRGALFVQGSFAISLGLDEEENEKRAELRIKT